MALDSRPSFFRAINRAFARGYIHFGRTAWWRILLGLAIILIALIVFIVYPTHRKYINAAKSKPERAAVVRVVKQAMISESKRIPDDLVNFDPQDFTPPAPTAQPALPVPTVPPGLTVPPVVPKTGEVPKKITLNKDGVHIEMGERAVATPKASASVSTKSEATQTTEARASTTQANVGKDGFNISITTESETKTEEETAEDTDSQWKIYAWGLSFTDHEWHTMSEQWQQEPLLTMAYQNEIESAARMDVRKALSGALALAAFSVLALVLLIVRGFAGRAVRQAQRVKVVEAAAKVDSSARQIAEAQLKAIQAQVEPHFLFNTLAHVKALQEIDVKQAGDMLDHLITYLRTALPNLREGSSTLSKEFDLAQSYLHILKLRMGDRLSFSLDLPESLKTQAFPPALIINLVENAVKHGLERTRSGGGVRLSAQRVGEFVSVTVADTGRGLDPSSNGGMTSTSGTGVGLSSIRDRLRMLYGDKAKLHLEPNSPTGVVATISLPTVAPDLSAPLLPPSPTADVEHSEFKIKTALLLAAVGGFAGAHNWYLKRKGVALGQVIFGVPAVANLLDGSGAGLPLAVSIAWLAVDAVLLSTKSMRDGRGKLVTIEK